jgi:hypothetical protein
MNFCCALSLLLSLPSSSSASWMLGGQGESCTEACSSIGHQCSSSSLRQRNSEVNSEREIGALIQQSNGSCVTYNLDFGSNTDVPAYQATTGMCYVSDIFRQDTDFSCDRPPSNDKQRLCWCHMHGTSEGHVTASSTSQKKRGSSGKISTSVIIWIVSGNMLLLGLVCMCCGIFRRLVKKAQGKTEGASLSKRPADAGYFVRCPACGCPLERSTSPSTYSRAVSKADEEGERSGQTVKFREDVSEVTASHKTDGVEVSAEEV